MALGDGSGKAGIQYGEPRSVSVGSSSTVVVSDADMKKSEMLAIVNDSNEAIYISYGLPAEMNKGIRLNATGGALFLYGPSVPKVAINAICFSGSKNLCVLVGS